MLNENGRNAMKTVIVKEKSENFTEILTGQSWFKYKNNLPIRIRLVLGWFIFLRLLKFIKRDHKIVGARFIVTVKKHEWNIENQQQKISMNSVLNSQVKECSVCRSTAGNTDKLLFILAHPIFFRYIHICFFHQNQIDK